MLHRNVASVIILRKLTALMNDLPASPRRRPLRWWIVPLILIAICIVAFLIPKFIWMIRYEGMPIAAMTGGIFVDCAWDATAQAWVDLDNNGKRDQNDPPLPGVMFHVDDVLNKYVDVAGRTSLSNWKGESSGATDFLDRLLFPLLEGPPG